MAINTVYNAIISAIISTNNNEYIDMSIMGIGRNSLGYGNDEVDEAVRAVGRHVSRRMMDHLIHRHAQS